MLRQALVLALCALSCAPKGAHPRAPARAAPLTPCVADGDFALRGYLGKTMVKALVARTDEGWRGTFQILGDRRSFELTGVREVVNEEEAEGEAVDPDEEVELGCHFELRSAGELFGTLDGSCWEPRLAAEAGADSLTVTGVWSLTSASGEAPAHLASPAYAAVPDTLYVALAHEDGSVHGCAPVVDVSDVRALPRGRLAVLYTRFWPCEPDTGTPDVSQYRLALVNRAELARPTFTGPLRGIEADNGEPSLAVHELGAHRYVFDLTFREEWHSPTNGRDYSDNHRALFALTAEGRAGELLPIRADGSHGDDCAGPFESVTPAFAELDGSPPAELLLQTVVVPTPCGDEPVEDTYTAYRLDPDSARFVLMKLGSGDLSVRWRQAWDDDISRPDETWRDLPAAQPDCVPAAPLASSGH